MKGQAGYIYIIGEKGRSTMVGLLLSGGGVRAARLTTGATSSLSA
jgi:hypothetical protein